MNPTTLAAPADYYSHARVEIGALLPASVGRVLEVGCGRGQTLAWLRATRRCSSTTGIEIDAVSAAAAREHADHIECGDADDALGRIAQRGPFDLVLCLDVLEHLVDPWLFVQKLEPLLAPGGTVIVSVPNVRHYKVSLALLFLGRWRYEAAGVLDRTHLRFFTREGACGLLDVPGLVSLRCEGSRPPPGSASWFANLLSVGLLRDLFSVQYLLAAQTRPAAR